MRRMIWVHQPELALVAGGQQEALREQLHHQGWEIRLVPYRPRMMWRHHGECDLLAWSLIPAQLDLWSARHLAREQVGIIHEINAMSASLPSLGHWIVPSQSLRERLCSRGVHPRQVSVVSVTPPFPSVKPGSLRNMLCVPESAYLIYAGGPLVPQTGGKLAIWALNILNYLHPNAHLVLHGTGIERERLEAFLHSIDPRRRCHFLPACFPGAQAVQEADQVWLPRQWDGVPDCLFYALQAGKPLLASMQPSMQEWLTNGQNAMLLPAQQPPAWSACANQLMEKPEVAARLGASARSTLDLCRIPESGWDAIPFNYRSPLLHVA